MLSQLNITVPGFVLPLTITFPVPFGASSIAPFAASTILMLPELVPPLVSNSKSNAPLEVIFPEAPPLPIETSPEPFGSSSIF